ncbi:hypothetical protein M409DRAFT_57069 [Zasmidium cellare ATCC 36951]|uniref:Uncharacterized protein n=1 Tax=Zasmidium cellare ATCC 36951 TaxID=1080233 RepID=A0A6A6CEY0_ZASCE|nr:uncharacterized protein M409DRAFT_57069 [Zasmidium cellare ATCC 36951]KAF2163966.1 hypothetical protein M409DRAFT_57069 [Zasmidium cellare ATCC 36951]
MSSSFAVTRQGSNDGGGSGGGGGGNPNRRSIDQVSIATTHGSVKKSPSPNQVNSTNGKSNTNGSQRQNGSESGHSWAMTQYQNDFQPHEARAYRLAQLGSQQTASQGNKTSSARRD